MGYVGLTAAGCLTKQGHDVLGVDVNESKVAQVNSGVSPIIEPGLDELLADAIKQGRLRAAQEPGGALSDCDIVMVCVGTPSMTDGSLNLSYIAEVSRQIAAAVDKSRTTKMTVVYRSTIRPGTMDTLIQPIFKAALGPGLGCVELVYNPEFLRESVAIKDYFAPPKIVIGTADGQPSANMEKVNEGLTAPVFNTRFREAEITKFVDNSFHALKVSFANEVGRVCVSLGIDPTLVHQIFVSDTKLNVSAQYLRPGGPFGGSCLPKDVRALQNLSSDAGANTHVIDALIRSNESHKQFIFSRCVEGLARGSKVLMLGLAFKANSDDLRESPNIDLARKLIQAGHSLSVYDPSLIPARLIGQNLGYAYANLPELSELLVDREAVAAGGFDRIIDVNGWGQGLGFSPGQVLNVSNLTFDGAGR